MVLEVLKRVSRLSSFGALFLDRCSLVFIFLILYWFQIRMDLVDRRRPRFSRSISGVDLLDLRRDGLDDPHARVARGSCLVFFQR